VLKGKISDSKLDKLGAVAGKIDDLRNSVKSEVDAIAKAIETWLTEKFKVSASDAELAVQHVRHHLPGALTGIGSDIEGLGGGVHRAEVISAFTAGVGESSIWLRA
jgi:hypothetical protein